MTPEFWDQIKHIFAFALECDASDERHLSPPPAQTNPRYEAKWTACWLSTKKLAVSWNMARAWLQGELSSQAKHPK